MTAGTAQPRKPGRQRRIIERPRLMTALDGCEARVILLLAPAGYGKTTLARQWLKTLNGAIWVSLTPAHRDVVTFAEDVAAGIDALGGDASPFIRELLRAQSNPQRHAREVAVAVADKANATGVQWLVLDDYHDLLAAPEAETIVTVLLERLDARFLIGTRARPSWSTARRALYGEIDELGQDVLAMTDDESGQMLRGVEVTKELVLQARGWPAVLALAAGLDHAPTYSNLPSSFHEYLAEEVFRAAGERLREELLQLSLLPDLSPARLQRQFGDRASVLVEEARSCGFLSGETAPELHPLIRDFLLSKLQERSNGRELAEAAVAECVEAENWDRALDLIQRFELHHLVRPTLEQAYLPLVRSARLGSLSRLALELRRTESEGSLEAELVDAEVALRDAEYRLAVQIVRRVRGHLPQGHTLASRAAAIEGAATTQLSEFDASERAFEAARLTASDAADMTEAIHGLALAAIYGERDSADRRLADLRTHAKSTCRPLDVLRHAACVIERMRIGEGFVDSSYIEDALRIVGHVYEPRVRASGLMTVTYALALQAELARAREMGHEMLATVEAFDLEFAVPHAHWNLAFIELAERQFTAADRHLKTVEDIVERHRVGHHLLNARALRARFLMELGRPRDGYEVVLQPVDDVAHPAMHAEYVATRALALSLLDREDEALEVAAFASSASVATEVHMLAAGARAIVAARHGDIAEAARFIFAARRRRTWEPVICCLRASPALAAALSRHDEVRADLEWLYSRSNDLGLARKAGFRLRTPRTPASVLSPRELEVLSLMAQGYRNRDIAQAFVISESTVKVHVRHILEKLGVRTRTQAVARFHEEG